MGNELLDNHLLPEDNLENKKPKTAVEAEARGVFKFFIPIQATIGLVFTFLVWSSIDNFIGFGFANLLIGFYGVVLGIAKKDKILIISQIATLLFCIISFVILNELGSNYRIIHTHLTILLGIYTFFICWYAYRIVFPVKKIEL